MSEQIVIIGGGVAGLAAAAFSKKALVLERMPSVGRKLLATGGGRCNITHASEPDEIAAQFGKRARFMLDALYSFSPDEICEFLAEQGVPTHVEADGCIFPDSGKACDVLDALIRAAERAGAEIRCDCPVKRICLDDAGEAATGVELVSGEFISANRVILAAGGRSQPMLGSDGSGFKLAESVGLNVTPVYPALGALHLAERWVADLAGVSCPNASIRVAEKSFSKRGIEGSILFTHKGISGPPILTISGSIAEALVELERPVNVKVSLDGSRLPADWMDLFVQWHQQAGTRFVRKLLSLELPRGVAEKMCELAEIEENQPAAHLNRKQMDTLAELCGACPLTVIATDGWAKSMVTRGGIALNELKSSNLECKRFAGLHCVGELVDLDAPCGGYNLTWALASGKASVTNNE